MSHILYIKLFDVESVESNNKIFFLNNYFKMDAIERKYTECNDIPSTNSDIYWKTDVYLKNVLLQGFTSLQNLLLKVFKLTSTHIKNYDLEHRFIKSYCQNLTSS